eukprot:142484-Amphidinium_carterae.1
MTLPVVSDQVVLWKITANLCTHTKESNSKNSHLRMVLPRHGQQKDLSAHSFFVQPTSHHSARDQWHAEAIT